MSSNAQGLRLANFLATLNWASDSHPPGTLSQSCIACKSSSLTSSVDQLPISIDRLVAIATFCVARHHRISFSAVGTSQRSVCGIDAVLAIDDAKLRLCLDVKEWRRCLTINLAQLSEDPQLQHTESTLCIQLVFPFVSLLLERPRQDAAARNPETARSRALQFAAMKEAVMELRDMPSSNEQSAPREGGESSTEKHVSLYEETLRKVSEREDVKEMSLDSAFTNFMNKGAEMVMPLCFPYNCGSTPLSVVGNTKEDHDAFVDAYITQEVVWKRTMEQVDAALYFAKRGAKKGNEKEDERTGGSGEISRVEALKGEMKPL